MPDGGYLGDISVEEAWDKLSSRPEATLVDVRTRAEWAYVGVPLLESIGKSPVLVEWQIYPTGQVDPEFVQRLEAALAERGIGPGDPLLFICRSGSRSRSAAVAMAAAGHTECFNIGPGFEGPLDKDGHRNSVSGWRLSGLPWSQT